MAVEVRCCIYNGDSRVINKNPTDIKLLQCRIVNDTDIINPTIYLEYDTDLDKCNYFVIGRRKYFKTRLKRVHNMRCEIQLHEDIISTWIPRVNIKGIIYNSQDTTTIMQQMEQGYPVAVNKIISRIKINNNYGTVDSQPAIIVQSPLSSKYNPAPPTIL